MKLVPMAVIEAAAFLLIIAETYFFFDFVVPVSAIPRTPTEYTGLALVKLALILGLVVVWFVVMVGLTRLYVRSKTRSAPKPSS
ncbi:MAG: hypothetical protein JRM80_02215 [Nitrososphaerota archaeon]|nr:hypothetical protein [Nitrososphaerota archaeon]